MTMTTTQPKDVSTAFILRYFLAVIGIYLGLLTPAAITLAVRVSEIAPETKEAALSSIVGVGALVALLANPLFGRLSDMTRSRFGRRKPWILGGMLVGTAATCAIAYTQNLWVIGLLWALAQGFYNATLATLLAVVPDHVPTHQRGRVSALVGMAVYIALMFGSWVFSLSGTGAVIFTLPSVTALACVAAFALFYPDAPSLNQPRAAGFWRSFVASFAVDPRKAPDFAWAWGSRFMVLFGFAVLMTYQVYFLTDVLHLPADQIGQTMFNAMVLTAVFVIIASFGAGYASDRLKRRKPFVIASAGVYALGIAVLIVADSLALFYLSIAVSAVGFGTYLAVDQALVVDILPDREADAAKDLGVFNIANAVPQALAPAIAPLFLAIGGGETGNYALLYGVAALAAVFGALLIVPVRGVR